MTDERKDELAEAIAARFNDPGSWDADVALGAAIRAACREVSREEIAKAKLPRVLPMVTVPTVSLEDEAPPASPTRTHAAWCEYGKWDRGERPHGYMGAPQPACSCASPPASPPKPEPCRAGYRNRDGFLLPCTAGVHRSNMDEHYNGPWGIRWHTDDANHIEDVLAEAQGAKVDRGCSVCGAKVRTRGCDEEACEPTTGSEPSAPARHIPDAGPSPQPSTVDCLTCDGWGEYLINQHEPKLKTCADCKGDGARPSVEPAPPPPVDRPKTCALPGCAGRATVFDIGSPRGYCQACVSRHMAECLFDSQAPAPAANERAASLREALVAIEEADASDPALVARAALDADDASVSEPSLSDEAKAIASAGFRVAPNLLGEPTLWCRECGRDSGFHWAPCRMFAWAKQPDGVAQSAPPPPVEGQAKWCETHQHYKPCVHNPPVEEPNAFADWWEHRGKSIDADTSDIHGYDKRKALAEAAFAAAMAQSGNYVTDDASEPRTVTFANGRTVSSEATLTVGRVGEPAQWDCPACGQVRGGWRSCPMCGYRRPVAAMAAPIEEPAKCECVANGEWCPQCKPIAKPAPDPAKHCGAAACVGAQGGCVCSCGYCMMAAQREAKPAPEQTAPDTFTVGYDPRRGDWASDGNGNRVAYVHPRIVSALESKLATVKEELRKAGSQRANEAAENIGEEQTVTLWKDRMGGMHMIRGYSEMTPVDYVLRSALSTARADLARVEGELEKAKRSSADDYDLVKAFDVYGTGGDLSGCLREMLMRISELDQIGGLEKMLGELGAELRDARSAIERAWCDAADWLERHGASGTYAGAKFDSHTSVILASQMRNEALGRTQTSKNLKHKWTKDAHVSASYDREQQGSLSVCLWCNRVTNAPDEVDANPDSRLCPGGDVFREQEAIRLRNEARERAVKTGGDK